MYEVLLGQLCLAICALLGWWVLLPKSALAHAPPSIYLSDEQIFRRPRESYERALREHGPVVRIKRKGRWEYIIAPQYAKQYFTDNETFSFERGVASMLNFQWLMRFYGASFFSDVDALVSEGFNSNLEDVVNQIAPVFADGARRLVHDLNSSPCDIFEYTQAVIAEAMVQIIFGKKYDSPEIQRAVISTAGGLAELTGIFQNTSYFARSFPLIWKFFTWFRVIAVVLGFQFLPVVGPAIWRDISRTGMSEGVEDSAMEGSNFPSLLSILVKHNVDHQGRVSLGRKLKIFSMVLAIIFASVHQTASTAVWVIYELSLRPDALKVLREECQTLSATDSLDWSYTSLRDARYLDSFIREVMRMKGDTLSAVRLTTRDVRLGDYTIPKDCFVIPVATLSNESEECNGSSATTFQSFRWVDDRKPKPAVMTGLGYIPFGMGRWACPGRALAVSEIKLIVMSLIAQSTPELVDGKYEVVDRLNTTSVPPHGRLILRPLCIFPSH